MKEILRGTAAGDEQCALRARRGQLSVAKPAEHKPPIGQHASLKNMNKKNTKGNKYFIKNSIGSSWKTPLHYNHTDCAALANICFAENSGTATLQTKSVLR